MCKIKASMQRQKVLLTRLLPSAITMHACMDVAELLQ